METVGFAIYYPTVAKLVASTDNLKSFLEVRSVFLIAGELCILLTGKYVVTFRGLENNKPETAEYEICSSNVLRMNQQTIIILLSVIIPLKIL